MVITATPIKSVGDHRPRRTIASILPRPALADDAPAVKGAAKAIAMVEAADGGSTAVRRATKSHQCRKGKNKSVVSDLLQKVKVSHRYEDSSFIHTSPITITESLR